MQYSNTAQLRQNSMFNKTKPRLLITQASRTIDSTLTSNGVSNQKRTTPLRNALYTNRASVHEQWTTVNTQTSRAKQLNTHEQWSIKSKAHNIFALNPLHTPVGRWQAFHSLLSQLSQCLTQASESFERLTLIRRQTQLSTWNENHDTLQSATHKRDDRWYNRPSDKRGYCTTSSRNVRSRGLWSKRSAIHNKSQSLLCSSSIHEPSDPPLKV